MKEDFYGPDDDRSLFGEWTAGVFWWGSIIAMLLLLAVPVAGCSTIHEFTRPGGFGSSG